MKHRIYWQEKVCLNFYLYTAKYASLYDSFTKIKLSATADHEEFFRATGGIWKHLSALFILKTLECIF